jgi:hypothetical protein
VVRFVLPVEHNIVESGTNMPGMVG